MGSRLCHINQFSSQIVQKLLFHQYIQYLLCILFPEGTELTTFQRRSFEQQRIQESYQSVFC